MITAWFFITADTQESEINSFQLICMQQFFHAKQLPINLLDPMQRWLTRDGLHNFDVCAWRGIECKGGKAIGLSISVALSDTAWLVSLDWLPPSLECVYLQFVSSINGWMAERLPQKLRFLYIRGDTSILSDLHRSVDLRKLPRNMEELMSTNGMYHGKVYLTNLPSTMRILWITSIPTKKVVGEIDILLKKMIFVRVTDGVDELSKVYRPNGKKSRVSMSKATEVEKALNASQKYRNVEVLWKGIAWDRAKVAAQYQQFRVEVERAPHRYGAKASKKRSGSSLLKL